MSLQKGMGIVVEHTHTQKQRRIPHLCTKQVRCAGTTQTPKARARSSQEVPTVPPIAGVGILEVPQLPLVDNETQPLCSTRPGHPFYRWVGWNIMVLFDGKYSCIGIRTQLTRLLGKHASVEPPRHTHTHTHTHKSKKPFAALVGHAFLVKPGHLCTKQVQCAGAMQTPGARARSSQEYWLYVPLTAGVGTL